MTLREIGRRAADILRAPLQRQPLFVLAATLMLGLGPYVYMACVKVMEGFLGFMVFTLMEGLLWAWLLAWLVRACRDSRWLKGVLLGLIWLMWAGDTLAVTLAHRTLSPATVFMALGTNAAEARGFFAQFGTPLAWTQWIFCLLLGAFLWQAGTFGRRCWHMSPLWRRVTAVVMAVDIIFGCWWVANMAPGASMTTGSQLEKWEFRGLTWKSRPRLADYWAAYSDLFTKAWYTSQAMRVMALDNGRWQAVNRRAWAEPASADAATDSVDVVMIIGESFRRDRSSLYGCPFPTNPRLQALADSGRLVVFADMVSTADFTSGSMKNLLTLNDVGLRQPWNEHPFWPLIFRRAGYSVSLLDNQSVGAGGDIFSMHQGQVLWDHFVRTHAYTHTNDSVYPTDGPFLNAVRPADGARRLVIYHLIGQHFRAGDKVPATSGLRRWTADDIPADGRPWYSRRVRSDIADYLNATLYNDSIVDEIVRRHASRPSVVVYFSDHGTGLYDVPTASLREDGPSSEADTGPYLRRNFDIPFMVWISPSYQARYPRRVAAIRAAAGRPGMLDRLGHAMMHLGGISSPYYRAEDDILSPSYLPRHRLLSSGHDYDAFQ